jgi:hypothetical protein
MVWDLGHFVLAEDRVTGGTLADPCFFAGETATKEEEELQLTRREEKRREEKRREEKRREEKRREEKRREDFFHRFQTRLMGKDEA